MRLTRAELTEGDMVAMNNDDGEPAWVPGVIVSTDVDENEAVMVLWQCSDEFSIDQEPASYLRILQPEPENEEEWYS